MLKLAAQAMSADVYCTQAGVPIEKMAGGSEFKTRFKQRFNTDVQLYAPYAYDATNALIEAMKLANSTDPAKYLPQLQKVNFKGVTDTVAFDPKGDNRFGGISLYQFNAGKWAVLN